MECYFQSSSADLGYAIRVVDLFTCWRGVFGKPQSVAVWKMVPSCLSWCIWRERNDRCFEDRESTVAELKSFFSNIVL
jgi:hypothetical protein